MNTINPLYLESHNLLFSQSEVNADALQKLLKQVVSGKVDIADIYVQKSEYKSFVLENSIIKSANYSSENGAGCRVVMGSKTGFATVSDITDLKQIKQALQQAYTIKDYSKTTIQQGNSNKSTQSQRSLYSSNNPLQNADTKEQTDLLNKIDVMARKNKAITQVTASLSISHSVISIITCDNIYYDIRPMVRLNISVLAEKDGKRRQGTSGGGGRYGDCSVFDATWIKTNVDNAVNQALINLEARAAPAGTKTVVLGSGWPGILLHEAIGHGLEADFNRKGLSVYSGMLNQKIASPLCTVIDDGTIQNARGSLNIDDEGTASQKNILIKDGILVKYMQDKQNANLMQAELTGNGRRQSYAHLPMPRMTNTYMCAGNSSQEEMIASVDDGILALNFGGGQVDITTGQFVFSMNLAYRIQKGKVTFPIDGATLIGQGKDVMTKISMVGDDLALDSGVGTCGKDGQSVAVGVGQPSVKIDSIVVGGTATS